MEVVQDNAGKTGSGFPVKNPAKEVDFILKAMSNY